MAGATGVKHGESATSYVFVVKEVRVVAWFEEGTPTCETMKVPLSLWVQEATA